MTTEAKPTPAEIDAALAANEDGDAALFIRLNRGRFTFDHKEKRWFRWAGHYWKEDTTGERYPAIQDVIALYQERALQVAAETSNQAAAGQVEKSPEKKKLDALNKRMFALHSRKRQDDVLKGAACGGDSLGITGDEWDRGPKMLPCENGVVSLVDGALLNGRPAWFHRAVCPAEYRGPHDPAPLWEKFLLEIFGGGRADLIADAKARELVAFVQRLFGYSLLGSSTEHRLPIFYGEGRNGKSVLLEAVGDALGSDLAGPVESALLLQVKFSPSAGNPTPEIMALRGKRIVWAVETKENERLDAGRVKKLTGGDTLTGRKLYGDTVNFKPSHLLLLLTNHKPRASADETALWDRVFLVPFLERFVDEPRAPNEHKKNPNLREALKREAPAILAWLVRGCLEYQALGLKPPAAVFAATDDYRESEDDLSHFLAEKCVVADGFSVRAGKFYNAYKQWAEDQGGRPISNRAFGERMVKRFRRKKEPAGQTYFGVRLVDNDS